MELFNNHIKLFRAAFLLFAVLTLFVAILPAISNQKNNKPLPGSEPLSEAAMQGKALYISNGCVACHTQQVRNVEMDQVWGSRPGIPADYAYNKRISALVNTATLMGTERTGPDLTSIGNRQPSLEWHLVHLYQPRAVVQKSIMPAYPWLFEEKDQPAPGDVVVNVPDAYKKGINGKIVATKDALNLVAYLQALKQVPLPDGTPSPEFLYKKDKKVTAATEDAGSSLPEGKSIYAANCQSCHQESGEGLKGAFPALKGSAIVINDNPELLIDIILNGYDAREEFAVMPAIGKNNNLSAEEISALINHERTSWGNNARKISVGEVQKIMDYLKTVKN